MSLNQLLQTGQWFLIRQKDQAGFRIFLFFESQTWILLIGTSLGSCESTLGSGLSCCAPSEHLPQLMVVHRGICVFILACSTSLTACHAPPTLPVPFESPGSSLGEGPASLWEMERSKGCSKRKPSEPGPPSSGGEAAADCLHG